MNLTIKTLTDLGACTKGLEWFKLYYGNKPVTVENTIRRLMSEHRWDWANWLLPRMLSRRDALRYALYAVQPIINNFYHHSDDPRPRNSVTRAILLLTHERPDTIKEADDAAYAASWVCGGAACVGWSASAPDHRGRAHFAEATANHALHVYDDDSAEGFKQNIIEFGLSYLTQE